MQLVPITYSIFRTIDCLYIVFFLYPLNQTLIVIEFIYLRLNLRMCLSDFSQYKYMSRLKEKKIQTVPFFLQKK